MVLGLVGLAACATVDPATDVDLTWDGAYVRVPGVLPLAASHRDKIPDLLPPGARVPTVIYLHGGGGLSRAAYGDIAVALKAGMAVIAPDSFARKRARNPGVDLNYTCPHGECWAIERTIFAQRTAELAHALERVRALPWVDQDNLFGWGHSEGGYTIAAYPGAVFNARIITGTGCAWGFRAKEPALAVISRDDPYVARHHLQYTRPSTCLKISGNAPNLTYVELPGDRHNAAQDPVGTRAVIEFLLAHLSAAR